jgi:hypothetical protein
MKVTIKGDVGEEGLASPVSRHEYDLQRPTRPFRMKPIALKFGVIKSRLDPQRAGRFGELLTASSTTVFPSS